MVRSDRSAGELRRELAAGLHHGLGLNLTVMVRTPAQLAATVAANPLLEAASTPTKLHVAFLSEPPGPQRRADLDPFAFAPDEVHLGGDVVYLWYPNGVGRSKLTVEVVERRLGVRATARNWNTVTRLLELVRGGQR